MRILLTGFACVVTISDASCVTMLHSVPESTYRDMGAQSPFGSYVDVTYTSGQSQTRGGGVLIGSQWVLTAAHVTWGSHLSGSVAITTNGQPVAAAQVFHHPAWATAPSVGLSQGADLALIRIPSVTTVSSPISISAPPLSDVGVVVGSGRSGTGLTGATTAAGVKLGAMNVIDRILTAGQSGRLLVSDFDDGTVSYNSLNQPTTPTLHYDDGFPGLKEALIPGPTSLSMESFTSLPTAQTFFSGLPDQFLEGTTASGDSGSPLYWQNLVTGAWEVAGITSWGTNPLLENGNGRQNSTYGDVAFYTDVSQHRDWIATVIGIPEPQSGLLLFIGLSFLAARRRRDAGGF
jgi:hypothetical protein